MILKSLTIKTTAKLDLNAYTKKRNPKWDVNNIIIVIIIINIIITN
jgi:hypothetical protein